MAKGSNSSAPTTAEIIGGVYNVTPPVLVDGQATALQVDVNGKLITSGSGGGGGNVNITGINGNPPATTNPLSVELSDGTNPVGTAGNPLSENVAQWGGTALSAPAVTSPVGTETAPVVRNIAGKTFRAISTTPPTTSATVFYGPNGMQTTRAAAGWFDSQQTGATFLEVGFFANAFQNVGNNGCYVDSTDDQANGPFNQLELVQAASGSLKVNLTQRYWQVRYLNGTSVVTTFTLNSNEWQGAQGNFLNPATGAQILDGTIIPDGLVSVVSPAAPTLNLGATLRTIPLATAQMATTTGGNGTWNYLRTPNIFKTIAAVAITAGTPVAIWTPAAGKKFRVMGFMLSLSVAGSVILKDATTEILRTPLMAAGIGLTSPPMGNGVISTTANNVLNADVTATGSVSGFVFGTEE